MCGQGDDGVSPRALKLLSSVAWRRWLSTFASGLESAGRRRHSEQTGAG